jgi:hypothetical protein
VLKILFPLSQDEMAREREMGEREREMGERERERERDG